MPEFLTQGPLPVIGLVVCVVIMLGVIWLLSGSEPTEDVTRSRRTRLESKSAKELREIGQRYGIKITGRAGNTRTRVLFYLITLVLPAIGLPVWGMLALDHFIFSLVRTALPFWTDVAFAALGVNIGLIVVVFATWQFKWYVVVPQLTGLKLMNWFTGRVHVATPGGYIRFLWEFFTPKDFLTLRTSIASRPATFNTKDGVQVTFDDAMLRSRVYPPLLLVNASHSIATIAKASTDVVQNAMSGLILEKSVEEVRTPKVLEQLPARLIKSLEGNDGRNLDIKGSTFEEQYGVIAEVAPFGIPEPAQDYVEARQGEVTMRIYGEAAARLVAQLGGTPDNPGITPSQALDTVMINAKESVNRVIHKLEVDERTERAVRNLGPAAGPLAAGVAAAVAGGAGRSADPHAGGHDDHGHGAPASHEEHH